MSRPKDPSFRELWRTSAVFRASMKIKAFAYSFVLLAVIVALAAVSCDQADIREAARTNEEQTLAIAEATKDISEARYRIDLKACERGKDLRRDVLARTRPLGGLITVILSNREPGESLSRQQQRLLQEFEEAQMVLRKSERRLIAEIRRNCPKTVRRPNGEERRLDEVIEKGHEGQSVPVPPAITVTTPGATRTVPGPRSTHTHTVTSTRTVTGPARTTTVQVERTVTLPARTETVQVEVPGPTQTVTQSVPVIVPPQTVTVTVEAPPLAPTGTAPVPPAP